MKTTKIKISILLIVAFTFVTNLSLASSNHPPKGGDEPEEHLIDRKKFDTDFIMDHVVDSYGWHIMDWPTDDPNKFAAVEVHLPIILLDGSLDVFSSGDFHHGHSIVERGDNHYMLFKNKIYKTDAHGSMTLSVPRVVKDEAFYAGLKYLPDWQQALSMEMHKDSIAYDEVKTDLHSWMHKEHELVSAISALKKEDPKGETAEVIALEKELDIMKSAKLQNIVPWDFSITKSVLALFVTVLLMLWFFIRTARFYRKNGALVAPKGIAAIFEPIILFVRDDIAIPNIGEAKYKKFMPYLLTVFFFIWITNMVGLLPFGFNLTGNIAVTFVLALFTMILTTFNGKRNYWGHIFWMPGVPVPMKIFLAPIEVIGMFAKPFALMIRLFANMTAGHIVVMSLIGLIFIKESLGWAGMSVPMTLFISLLELLVAALQAYVFTMLSALFIGSAVEEAHH